MKEVHHLSHIDLDGYGAQFVASHFFTNITFYNANYGKEVSVRLKHIINTIKDSSNNDFLILVTDLNLTMSEAKFLQGEVDLLNAQGKKTSLILLDHHITGKDCAENYAWYHLDSTICASKITLNYLKENITSLCVGKSQNLAILNDSKQMESLTKFIDMIDSADTWKEDGFAFEFGKVALGMITQSKEFSRFMFDEYDVKFKFEMLKKAQQYLLDSNNNLRENAAVELDNNIFLFKKDILGGDKYKQTMEQILSQKQAQLLTENKQKYLISLNGKKGILTYGIGGISVLANLFLRQNSELDFFMDIGMRGTVSLRANGKCDVSEISKEIFKGGGHKNAAGGRIDGFKETFLYSEARLQVEAVLKGDEDDDKWQL